MGLDIVELVMRTEEVFGIEIPNEDAAACTTVGAHYSRVLKSLFLPEWRENKAPTGGTNRLCMQFPALKNWTQADVWATLHALILDQLQLRDDEVVLSAHFQDDLGAD